MLYLSILFVCVGVSVVQPSYSHTLLPQISFFKMGSENLNEQLEEFLTNIGTSVQK